MRQVILDTETTGLRTKDGNRIVEIGLVEIIDRKVTGRTFWKHVNPDGKEVEPEALKVHGLDNKFLADKPTFREVYDEFHAFVQGAEVLIHNADFDVDFLNMELDRIGKPKIWDIATKVECTVKMAKSLFPKKRVSLDALCKDLGVNNEHRTLHGALLDSQLLAEVYLKMTENAAPYIDDEEIAKMPRPPISRVARTQERMASIGVSDEQEAANAAYLEGMEKDTKKKPVWLAERPSAPKP